MNTDDVVTGGWSPPHSIAMLLLATARAGTISPPASLARSLIAGHLHIPALRPEVVITAAAEELETHYRHGGLKAVIAALQSHCRRLEQCSDAPLQRQIIAEMIQVADAVTDTPLARRRVYAFPYAAARVWQLDVADMLMTP